MVLDEKERLPHLRLVFHKLCAQYAQHVEPIVECVADCIDTIKRLYLKLAEIEDPDQRSTCNLGTTSGQVKDCLKTCEGALRKLEWGESKKPDSFSTPPAIDFTMDPLDISIAPALDWRNSHSHVRLRCCFKVGDRTPAEPITSDVQQRVPTLVAACLQHAEPGAELHVLSGTVIARSPESIYQVDVARKLIGLLAKLQPGSLCDAKQSKQLLDAARAALCRVPICLGLRHQTSRKVNIVR